MRLLIVVFIILIAGGAQAQTYTGTFFSPSTEGLHTDNNFNLLPNSGSTTLNNWNIYHKDGGSIFSLWYGAAQPYIHVGVSRTTNLIVNGNLGVGTSNPKGTMHLSKSANDFNVTTDLVMSQFNGYSKISGLYTGTFKGAITFATNNQSAGENDNNIIYYERMRLTAEGNLGIGTTVPDAKLAVKGTIHSQEVKVDMQGSMVPDYVFESSYTLPSLDSVQSYINQNKHLPEVPSAKEMEANGVNLGEMNMLLLKKVEELTLYMLQQQKQIQLQQHEITQMKQQMKSIKMDN